MKKLIFTLFAVLFIYSCASGPEKAARNFSENMAKGKVEEAKKYATEPTAKMLDLVSTLSSFGGNNINPDFKFELVKDSIEGNRAWVTFVDKSTDDEQTLELVKIDGDWKVNMDKAK
ncbi:MAG: DUF4878 domain-containing protein [Dysgonomonas sp.]|nr:DUF4878 domain-containing protein [Dysgonomonas sp.]